MFLLFKWLSLIKGPVRQCFRHLQNVAKCVISEYHKQILDPRLREGPMNSLPSVRPSVRPPVPPSPRPSVPPSPRPPVAPSLRPSGPLSITFSVPLFPGSPTPLSLGSSVSQNPRIPDSLPPSTCILPSARPPLRCK